MDGVAAGLLGGFVDGFAERGMRVDRGDEFFVGGFHLDGESELGDHFGGVGAKNVRAEDFAVGFAEEDFDKAFAFADGKRFAAGHEGEFSDFELEAFFFGGALGQADAGHLWFAVGAAGEDVHFAW